MVGQTVGAYEITGELGGGGMGIVYRARDTVLDRFVALKFVKADRGDPLAVQRFFREARAASALNHPNIITIHEIGESDGASYIVMEHVEGRTLRAVMSASLAMDNLLSIGVQVAKALAAAHSAGIVHRDIKPENIMVREDGYVKVLDFGLATRLRSQSTSEMQTQDMTNPGTLIGSVPYMSPEQARGETLTGASDVFSLGLVLYEMATRKHPFRMSNNLATLQAIIAVDPLPPSRFNPGIYSSLDTLVLSMLDKDVRRRPSAPEVIAVLEQKDVTSRSAIDSNWTTAHAVGRQNEHLELRKAYDESTNGRGSLFCIAGEAGLGKTTLVEGFLSELPEAMIARGRCLERLAGAEAYLPVFEALSGLLRGAYTASANRVMKLVAPSWFLQVASLSEHEASMARVVAESRVAASQERMKRELVEFFADLSRIRPVVLFLEDLHWADVSTIDLLNYLGNQCGEMRMLIAATYRPSEILVEKHPFRQVKLELQGRRLAREITLGVLGFSSLQQYLDLEFPDNRFPGDFAGMIYSKTEGHPLFMTDVLRDLRDRGVIINEHGYWELSETVPVIEQSLPASVRSMIERKMERLDDEDRRLLGAASVQGAEFDSAMLAEVLAMEPDLVEDRLDALDRLHALVRLRRETEFPNAMLSIRYRFVHILYQNVLVASLSAARRARLSLSIARTLEKFHGARASEIAPELAYLFEVGRDFASASACYLTAARNAARVFAHHEVILLARRGLHCLQRLAATAEGAAAELSLQLLLGSSLMSTRGFADPDVLTTYRRASELSQRKDLSEQQITAFRGLWAFYLVRAEYSTAIELAQQLMELAESTDDPVARIEAHLGLGFTLSFVGDEMSAARHFEAGIAITDPRPRPDHALMFALDSGVGCRAQLGTVAWYLGYPDRALALCHESRTRAEKLGSPYSIAWTLMSNSLVYQNRGEMEETFSHSEASIALAKENDFRDVIGWALLRHGWCLVHKSRVDEGLAEMQAYLDNQLRIGARISRTNAVTQYAECLLHLKRWENALAILDECLKTDVVNGEGFYEPELNRLKGIALMALGEHHAAEASFREAKNIAIRNQTKGWELRAATNLGRLLRDRKRFAEAREILAPVYAWFTEGLNTRDLREARRLLNELK